MIAMEAAAGQSISPQVALEQCARLAISFPAPELKAVTCVDDFVKFLSVIDHVEACVNAKSCELQVSILPQLPDVDANEGVRTLRENVALMQQRMDMHGTAFLMKVRDVLSAEATALPAEMSEKTLKGFIRVARAYQARGI